MKDLVDIDNWNEWETELRRNGGNALADVVIEVIEAIACRFHVRCTRKTVYTLRVGYPYQSGRSVNIVQVYSSGGFWLAWEPNKHVSRDTGIWEAFDRFQEYLGGDGAGSRRSPLNYGADNLKRALIMLADELDKICE